MKWPPGRHQVESLTSWAIVIGGFYLLAWLFGARTVGYVLGALALLWLLSRAVAFVSTVFGGVAVGRRWLQHDMRVIAIVIALGVAALPARAQDTQPSAVTRIQVDGQIEGSVAERLLFRLREEFRRARAFELVELGGEWRISLLAIPARDDNESAAAVYSVVWILQTDDGLSLFISQSVGLSGTNRLNETAEGLVATTDRLIRDVFPR